MFVDNYIPIPGQVGNSSGSLVPHFAGRGFDTGLRRPFLNDRGVPCVRVLTGNWTVERGQRVPLRQTRPLRDFILNGVVPPVFNATALRKEEWIELDKTVLKAARPRLRIWSDIAAANTFGGFNGMGKMLLEHETMSDPGEALVDMDGLSEGRDDKPAFQLEGLPLPITHSDWYTSQRVLTISRNTGTPLDMTMGEASGRRVAESVEKVTLGVDTGIVYGGNSTHVGGYGRTSQVYGLLNFGPRLTKTNFTAPTAGGWVPSTLITEINLALNQLRTGLFYGPFMLYCSNDWDPYLDGDYYHALTSGAVAPTRTLRERVKAIDGITDVRRLDYLTGTATDLDDRPHYVTTANPFTLLFVQMTADVARAVVGMDITTVQWESKGGMQINYKTMCIMVPQLRADYYGRCGILHGTTS